MNKLDAEPLLQQEPQFVDCGRSAFQPLCLDGIVYPGLQRQELVTLQCYAAPLLGRLYLPLSAITAVSAAARDLIYTCWFH